MGSEETGHAPVPAQCYMPGLAPGIREALDWLLQEYGIGSDRITEASIKQGVRGPAVLTITMLVQERAPELLREQASRLLTVANEREGLSAEVLHDVTAAGERTLGKVQSVLSAHGIEAQDAIDLVSDLQNEGILFREREEH